MRLIISPASEVARICREARPSHLLRLVSPEYAADVEAEVDASLTLVMHDITRPEPGRLAPDRPMIEALLDFASSWNGERPFACQCWAGVSRSTAAAFIIACRIRPDAPEQAIAADLRRVSPQATPNRLMVAHADAQLARGGRMIAAVAEIGRGADFSQFSSAELNLADL